MTSTDQFWILLSLYFPRLHGLKPPVLNFTNFKFSKQHSGLWSGSVTQVKVRRLSQRYHMLDWIKLTSIDIFWRFSLERVSLVVRYRTQERNILVLNTATTTTPFNNWKEKQFVSYLQIYIVVIMTFINGKFYTLNLHVLVASRYPNLLTRFVFKLAGPFFTYNLQSHWGVHVSWWDFFLQYREYQGNFL